MTEKLLTGTLSLNTTNQKPIILELNRNDPRPKRLGSVHHSIKNVNKADALRNGTQLGIRKMLCIHEIIGFFTFKLERNTRIQREATLRFHWELFITDRYCEGHMCD